MRRRHGADASAERLPRAREALADLSSVLGDRVARIGLFGPTAQSPPPRLVTSFPARTAECDPLASEPYLCVIIGTVWQRPGWLGECVDGRLASTCLDVWDSTHPLNVSTRLWQNSSTKKYAPDTHMSA